MSPKFVWYPLTLTCIADVNVFQAFSIIQRDFQAVSCFTKDNCSEKRGGGEGSKPLIFRCEVWMHTLCPDTCVSAQVKCIAYIICKYLLDAVDPYQSSGSIMFLRNCFQHWIFQQYRLRCLVRIETLWSVS